MKSRKQQCAVTVAMVMAMCGAAAAAEEVTTQMKEVVVTATRDEVPIEQVGSSITVVTAREIEQKQVKTAADVLRSVPGLDVVRSGGLGSTSSIYLRGANPEHTLVLLDGMVMNNPSSAKGVFDFAHLPASGIERIEILRGPQGTLYGSSAIAGVINIITKQGDGKHRAYVSAEAGSFGTARETAGLSGGFDKLQYAFSATRVDSDGISSASTKYGNHEKDPYQNTSILSKISLTPNAYSELSVGMHYNSARNAIDNGGGLLADDPNNLSRTEDFYIRPQGTLSLFKGQWEQRLGLSYSRQKLKLDNPVDSIHPSDLSYGTYQGEAVAADWQHTLNLHATNSVTFGVEQRHEGMHSSYHSEDSFFTYDDVVPRRSVDITSLYLQDQINLWQSWFTTVGLRLDHHQQFGDQATYRITSAYQIAGTDTKLKGSIGTGFKAPTLYQLYSQYGDTTLNPEKSVGWDLGIEQKFSAVKAQLEASFFHNEITDMILFSSISSAPWGVYKNISRASTQGVELLATVQPVEELSFKANYTYTQTEDHSTGAELLRRPKNKASLYVNYQPVKQANISIGILYVDSRKDQLFDPITYATQNLKLKEYTLINLAASYDVTKNLQLFGRVDNLFDKKYEEVAGYGTPGISAFGGAKVSF